MYIALLKFWRSEMRWATTHGGPRVKYVADISSEHEQTVFLTENIKSTKYKKYLQVNGVR